ncbi:MAG: hypothetical protein M1817_002716 [Caeruleum heppii]|nr:MAG: hypothetical protein M1817_002716 [Caeruleum heppii]
MSDYNTLKVPDLKKLLQERSLPVSGNKAELIARLQENDSSSTSAAPPAAEPAKAAQPPPTVIAPPAEDEIDWDDDDAAKPSEPAAAAMAAGGQGQVANPVAVPNQKLDVDPAQNSDLTVQGDIKTGEEKADSAPAPPAEAAAAPAPDFTAGLATTSLDKELEARKTRAKRFGIVESEGDAIKALERSKRFGTGTAEEQAAGSTVKGLDQALPENRKRTRGGDEGGRGGKRQQMNGGGRRGDQEGRRQGDGGARRGGRIMDDPTEKAKAEARAKKFAAAA